MQNTQTLLFIGGAPRSGTTLVQKMMNAHPSIYGGPEFDRLGDIVFLKALLQKTNEKGRSKAYYDERELDEKVAQFIRNLLAKPANEQGCSIISEKTPGNIFYLKELLKIDVTAKAIIVIRDPRSIIASMKKVKEKAQKANEVVPGFTKNASHSVQLIKKYWNAGFRAFNFSPDRVLVVRYEDIISDSLLQAQKMCNHIGIDYNEAMLNPGKSNFDRGVNKDNIWYSDKDHQRGIDTASLEKWKKILTKHEIRITESMLLGDYNRWSEIVEDKQIKTAYPDDNNSKKNQLRKIIVRYLSKNDKIRSSLYRLIKESTIE